MKFKYEVDPLLRRSQTQAFKALLSDRAPMSMSRPVPRGIVVSAALTATLVAIVMGAALAGLLQFVFGGG